MIFGTGVQPFRHSHQFVTRDETDPRREKWEKLNNHNEELSLLFGIGSMQSNRFNRGEGEASDSDEFAVSLI